MHYAAGPEERRVSVSEFKAHCLRLFEEMRETGEPIVVTKRGVPIAVVQPSGPEAPRRVVGAMKGTGRILGDVVAPALDEDEYGNETFDGEVFSVGPEGRDPESHEE